jgi:hypothetical protein
MTPDIDPAALTEPAAPPETASDELAKAQAEIASLKDAFLRAKAEADNARKIAQADVAKAHKFAIESFAEDLLPVKDALEKALATPNQTVDSLKAGADLTLKALQSALARGGRRGNRPGGPEVRPEPPPGHAARGVGAARQHGRGRVPEGLPHQRPHPAPGLVTVSNGEEAKGG